MLFAIPKIISLQRSISLTPCELSIPIFHLLFSLYGYHRDLHSFPTRRSSDLRWWAAARVGSPWAHSLSSHPSSPSWKESRSEEHTSELQSRLHLVCRLLLEKKKKVTKVS